MRFASESGGAFKRYHPTQKPVKLIEEIIKIHSNEGDLVLDPFMGSGTTAISAINTGRHYIGFELDEKYYDILTDRIAEYMGKPIKKLETKVTTEELQDIIVADVKPRQPVLQFAEA